VLRGRQLPGQTKELTNLWWCLLSVCGTATFQRLITAVLNVKNTLGFAVYLDDISILEDSDEEFEKRTIAVVRHFLRKYLKGESKKMQVPQEENSIHRI
jgi:hypothetical protein